MDPSGPQHAPAQAEVAIHGIVVPLPAGYEVVGTYGGWRRGHLLIAEGRQARLSVSWARHAAAPDLSRTLRTAGNRPDPGHVAGQQVAEEVIDQRARLGSWDGAQGAFHAAVRHFPEAGITVVARQLAPGASQEMRILISAVRAIAPGQPAPWRIYGLDLELPPYWRLEGLQQLAGLVRAVWFRYPGQALRPDQLLVMRRLACASRLLAGSPLGDWVRSGLSQREQVTASSENASVVHLSTTLPSANWWRRLRGRPDRRELYAWRVADLDRLVVQEWKGAADPLPCLRGA
jgi:hypothetical protein